MTLATLRAVREQTRRDLQTFWFALIVFGALTLLSVPFFSVWDGSAVGLFWLVATPAGGHVVVRHARTRGTAAGLTRAGRSYAVLGACLVLACVAIGVAAGIGDDPEIANYAPPLLVAVAYMALAWLERSVALGLVALLLGMLTIALASAGVANGGQALAFVYGASFVILGLVSWPWTPRR